MSVLALAPACAFDNSAEDGPNDSFLSSGKTDTGGVEEGSREAQAVLAIANDTPIDELVALPPAGVGLTQQVADNLIGVRIGDDGVAGTEDDGKFETLAQLDAVPYVGPIAFAHMLDFGRLNAPWQKGWLAAGAVRRDAVFGFGGSEPLQCTSDYSCPSGPYHNTFTTRTTVTLQGDNPGSLGVVRNYADEGGGPFTARLDDWDGTWSGRTALGPISGAILPGGIVNVTITLDPGGGQGTCTLLSWSCTGSTTLR